MIKFNLPLQGTRISVFNISSSFSGLAKLRDQLLYAKVIFVKMVVVSKGKCVCEEMFIVDERLFTSPLRYEQVRSPHTSNL